MKKVTIIFAVALLLQLPVAAQIRITHGPWLTDMSENGVTIMWKTDKPSMAWVEYDEYVGNTFYSKYHPVAYDSKDGRRRVLDTLHCVKLEGLKPGTEYFYRIFSKETVSYGDYGNMVFGNTVASSANYDGPTHFRTFSSDADNVCFAVINDIHENPERIGELFSGIDVSKLDFVLLNGDMLSTVNGDGQIYSKLIDACVGAFARSVPIVYARGNHETRGCYSDKLGDYFPTRAGRFYYDFNVGKTNFIILDCGEDKPDTDFEYSGMSEFDSYREKQADWLKSVAENSGHQTRIVALHIPPMAGNWHGNIHIREKFLPVLNSAGVDLMLSGHDHSYGLIEPSENQNFVNIINDNESLMLVEIAGKNIQITVSGKTDLVWKNF